MKLRYTDKSWIGAPVFVVEGEPPSRLSPIDMIPAIVVSQSEFDRIEADSPGKKRICESCSTRLSTKPNMAS